MSLSSRQAHNESLNIAACSLYLPSARKGKDTKIKIGITSTITALFKRRKAITIVGRETIAAYLFLLPTALGFFVFIAGPLITAIVLSFFQWNLISPPQFTGLQNYKSLLQDPRFIISFRNSLFYMIGAVSLNLITALSLALAIQRSFGVLKYFFRTAYFFPVLTSLASVCLIWQFLLHTELGAINYYLTRLGFPRTPWLSSSQWALPSVIFVGWWKTVGFNMVLFLAGLQKIPRRLYEAASIDGASPFQKFWSITFPLLSPVMFFVIIITLINTAQIFDAPYIMTKGGPGDSSRSFVMYIYLNAFQYFDMGYASAVAMFLFLVILIFTMIQFKLGKEWVFYT